MAATGQEIHDIAEDGHCLYSAAMASLLIQLAQCEADGRPIPKASKQFLESLYGNKNQTVLNVLLRFQTNPVALSSQPHYEAVANTNWLALEAFAMTALRRYIAQQFRTNESFRTTYTERVLRTTVMESVIAANGNQALLQNLLSMYFNPNMAEKIIAALNLHGDDLIAFSDWFRTQGAQALVEEIRNPPVTADDARNAFGGVPAAMAIEMLLNVHLHTQTDADEPAYPIVLNANDGNNVAMNQGDETIPIHLQRHEGLPKEDRATPLQDPTADAEALDGRSHFNLVIPNLPLGRVMAGESPEDVKPTRAAAPRVNPTPEPTTSKNVDDDDALDDADIDMVFGDDDALGDGDVDMVFAGSSDAERPATTGDTTITRERRSFVDSISALLETKPAPATTEKATPPPVREAATAEPTKPEPAAAAEPSAPRTEQPAPKRVRFAPEVDLKKAPAKPTPAVTSATPEDATAQLKTEYQRNLLAASGFFAKHKGQLNAVKVQALNHELAAEGLAVINREEKEELAKAKGGASQIKLIHDRYEQIREDHALAEKLQAEEFASFGPCS